MNQNIIDVKSLHDLLGLNFFIPCYQRGYRWTERNVKDLLGDILDFTFPKKKHAEGEFYCLQPLVVKAMSIEEKQKHELPTHETWYEVVDGQQRLTTLFLILSSQQDFLRANNIYELYKLKYERATGAESLFENLQNLTIADESTIDTYFISKAYLYIRDDWFRNEFKKNRYKYVNTFVDSDIEEDDDEGLKKDRANNVRVIWYELVDEDPVEVFTRLNIGKIALTNSELVKALILNSSNFKSLSNENETRLRQQEIASAWDEMEYTLQDEMFWLFIHGVGDDRPTRIDFIFDLIKRNNGLELNKEELAEVGDDEYATFRYFYAYFKRDKADVKECWDKIQDYFNVIREWYDDVEIYHYIGFLFAYEQYKEDKEENTSAKLIALRATWDNASSKDEFVMSLKTEIKDIVTAIPLDRQYNIDGSDKRDCWPILLFHNIQTAINMNRVGKTSGTETVYKFPFNLFKNEKWDVEHINSNTTNDESEAATRNEWLVNIYLGVENKTKKKIQDYFSACENTGNKDEADSIYKEIQESVSIPDDWTPKDKNRIWNYALLDSSTNRSYGNAIFSGKRRVIICKDKGIYTPLPQLNKKGAFSFQTEDSKKVKSCFVPPCTRYVFMKYYSPSVNDVNYWTKDIDATAYKADIKRCIDQLTETHQDENGQSE